MALNDPHGRYIATVNIPGYLPTSDDPALFDTAAEAWDYLLEELERGHDDAEDVDQTALYRVKRDMLTMTGSDAEGTVWAPTPGRMADDPHDLGLNYSVSWNTDDINDLCSHADSERINDAERECCNCHTIIPTN